MTTLRRLSQGFSLALFIALILVTVKPDTSPIPVNLFFITNPLLAIISMIASRTFLLVLIACLSVIILTIFLGRVYCSWLCPMGSTIDIFNYLFLRWKKKQWLVLRWHKIKYLVLAVMIITAILGVNLAGWLDPISLAWKSYGLVIYPTFESVVKNISGKFFLIESPIFFQSSLFFLTIFILILLANIFQVRFWCRNLCPLGGFLALLSKWSLLKVHRGKHCLECDLCSQACRMGTLQNGLVSLPRECLNCFTCVKICKSNELSINFKGKQLKSRQDELPGRRAFLSAALLGVVSIPLLNLKKSVPQVHLRPPGAERNRSKFLARCIRCGICMKTCPSNGLQPLFFQDGFYAMWSPILIPRIGYCLYECNLCGQVCPTGAIAPLTLQEKQKWQIGIAQVDKNRCRGCLRCEEFCPIPEKAIKIYEDKGQKYLCVVEDICIGCGACENVCPVSPPAIKVQATFGPSHK